MSEQSPKKPLPPNLTLEHFRMARGRGESVIFISGDVYPVSDYLPDEQDVQSQASPPKQQQGSSSRERRSGLDEQHGSRRA